MGAYKPNMVAVIKMGATFRGAHFLWVPIILILRYINLKCLAAEEKVVEVR